MDRYSSIVKEIGELVESYSTNDYGVITTPGKFEGEHISTPYFWNLVLDGCSDEDLDHNETLYSVLFVGNFDEEEKKALKVFGIFSDDADFAVVLHEDELGFVYGEIVSKEEFEEWRRAER